MIPFVNIYSKIKILYYFIHYYSRKEDISDTYA
jgi:hypothetical protein